ncbi:immunoglobulin superfamily member 1-like [Eublepharis macularius]|uniref:immunoglobulin superfamily member 1-like n=1 Tax=Eublepharis macularius TaxID=481883 RepID=UPI0024105451|nr:immunoglobulin superfamily member 1-like [Eublepharis macularius]
MMSTFSIFLLWLVGSSEERKWESERFLNVFIFVRPLSWGLSVGQEASISCRSNYPGFFYVTKDGWTWKHRGILSARYAEFLISYMNREDTGVYTCCCRFYNNYQDETRCSESVELLITDPDLPRPRISLIPSRMAVIGSNITFQCLLQDRHENVYLHKTGAWQKPQEMESHGSTAVFHIRNVSPGDGGTFSCSYRLSSEFLVSNPSVPEKLWVLDPTLPKPSITLTPEKGSLGGKVSIDCKSSRKVEHFYLQRPGHQSLLQGPVAEGIWARFTIQNVSKKHTGNYSCMYKPLFSKHPVFSLPSDPVTLLLPGSQLKTLAFTEPDADFSSCFSP